MDSPTWWVYYGIFHLEKRQKIEEQVNLRFLKRRAAMEQAPAVLKAKPAAIGPDLSLEQKRRGRINNRLTLGRNPLGGAPFL